MTREQIIKRLSHSNISDELFSEIVNNYIAPTCRNCKHEEIKNDLDPLNVLPDYCRGCLRCSDDKWESKE